MFHAKHIHTRTTAFIPPYKTVYTFGQRLHEHIAMDGSRTFCGVKHGKNPLKQDLMWLNVLVAIVVATTCFALIHKNW